MDRVGRYSEVGSGGSLGIPARLRGSRSGAGGDGDGWHSSCRGTAAVDCRLAPIRPVNDDAHAAECSDVHRPNVSRFKTHVASYWLGPRKAMNRRQNSQPLSISRKRNRSCGQVAHEVLLQCSPDSTCALQCSGNSGKVLAILLSLRDGKAPSHRMDPASRTSRRKGQMQTGLLGQKVICLRRATVQHCGVWTILVRLSGSGSPPGIQPDKQSSHPSPVNQSSTCIEKYPSARDTHHFLRNTEPINATDGRWRAWPADSVEPHTPPDSACLRECTTCASPADAPNGYTTPPSQTKCQRQTESEESTVCLALWPSPYHSSVQAPASHTNEP